MYFQDIQHPECADIGSSCQCHSFPEKKKENWCWTVWILVLTKLRNKSLGWTQWFKQRKLKVEWFSNRATFLYVSSLVDRSGQNHRECHLWNSPILVITTSLSKFLFNIKSKPGNLGHWERFALKRKENVPPFALQEARYCLSMVYLKSTNLTFPYVLLPQPTTVTHQLAAHLSSIHRPVCGQIECHVVDSTSFPQLIRSYRVTHNEIMVSFDVGSLSTNAPVVDALRITHNHLSSDHMHSG